MPRKPRPHPKHLPLKKTFNLLLRQQIKLPEKVAEARCTNVAAFVDLPTRISVLSKMYFCIQNARNSPFNWIEKAILKPEKKWVA
jgi:hypothetical protein